jgi:SPP1 gp7 family putative phage head morphogenesis protein
VKFDLAKLATGKRGRKTFRDYRPPAILATDIYRAGYWPVIKFWQERLTRIIAAYERALLVTDSPRDIANEIDQGADDLERLFILLRPTLERALLQVEKWQRGKWIGAALAASGVDLSTMLGPQDVRNTLDVTIARNVDLVKDVSAQIKQRISAAVFDGLSKRQVARDVAKAIRGATELGRGRSLRIASDQLGKVAGALADERRRQAGIDKWEWKSSGKVNFREDHAERDGNIYSDKDPPPTMPGEEINCGCRQLAVMDFD